VSEFEFVPATKEQAKARVALAGPSGSGKTWTSLVLATVLAEGGRFGVIDTERGSASKYAGPFTFDRLNLYTYDPRDLVKALAASASAGHAAVMIDSLSRFWGGTGGMLEIVDNAAKRSYGGNSFGGWKEARPIENDMIEAILGYPGHVIVTMRTKTAYEITKTDNGKTVPVKIGLQPEQRNGIEYEFDVVADMDLENNFTLPGAIGQGRQPPWPGGRGDPAGMADRRCRRAHTERLPGHRSQSRHGLRGDARPVRDGEG
jgi:AAA domain-containing protein